MPSATVPPLRIFRDGAARDVCMRHLGFGVGIARRALGRGLRDTLRSLLEPPDLPGAAQPSGMSGRPMTACAKTASVSAA